jgi:hypothetical protein
MTEIKLDTLTEIEEIQSVLDLHDEAKEYLENFHWCISTKKCWYDKHHGIYEKIGIFLFEIEPLNDTIDDFIWVIVGDLPSVYLDKIVTTAREALETYCELMQQWADNVKNGKSIENCYPVNADTTIENADLLSTRISFIRRELLLPDEE